MAGHPARRSAAARIIPHAAGSAQAALCYTRAEASRVSISVVIVGGGLMGLSTAWHLRREDPGVVVTLLERRQVGAAASGASAAGVRVMGRDPAERPLALASLARWPDLARELGHPTGYRRGGGLRVALDDEAWRAAPAWVAEQEADGVALDVVDAASARRLAPGLTAGSLGGVYSAIDGQADAMGTVHAFAAAARGEGARIEEGVGAHALVADGGRLTGVRRTDGVVQGCDVAVLAAGVWTSALLAGVGVGLGLETRPLQMLLTATAPAGLDPVLGAFGRKLSFKQLDSGAYLIGGGWPARVVDQADNAWELIPDSVRASLAAAREVYPCVAGASFARGWAGLEAFTPDEVPVLGPVPGIDGLLVAAGFSGHGFALSPMIGDVLARLALGRDVRAELWHRLRFDRPSAPRL
jgi:sarcosine oxidase subunit beta